VLVEALVEMQGVGESPRQVVQRAGAEELVLEQAQHWLEPHRKMQVFSGTNEDDF
jgi:hypothetical protein